MSRLAALVSLLLCLWEGCATTTTAKQPFPPVTPQTVTGKAEAELGETAVAKPASPPEPQPESPPRSLVTGLPAPVSEESVQLPAVSALDLDHWPFGWVSDWVDTKRLGLENRFWSDQKSLWVSVEEGRSQALNALRLTKIFGLARSTDEAFRAAWHLWQVYHEAGSTAIFDNQPFERRLRDINSVSQQLQGRRTHFETVGLYLLGGEPNFRWL